MSPAPSQGHWLDRLAVRLAARHTRRQAFKAAAGGALALALFRSAEATVSCAVAVGTRYLR